MFFKSDLRGVRCLLGVAEVVTGFVILVSDVHREIMWQLLPGDIWAMVFMGTGLAHFKVAEQHGIRARVFALWDAILWIFVTSCMIASGIVPPSSEVALTVGTLWVLLRVGYKKGD